VSAPGASPHAYPSDLAAAALDALRASDTAPIESPLLAHAFLTRVLSTVFQASLLREEDRSVSLRLLLCPPDRLPPEAGPPDGLHALRFAASRPLDVRELRRLASAAPFARALIGACLGADRESMLWGVVHSGPRWLRIATGARVGTSTLPPVIVVTASGPGRVDVRIGDLVLAQLEGGRIGGTTFDVFGSRWFPAHFAAARAMLLAQHAAARERAGSHWAELDERLVAGVARHMLRQMIAVIRLSGHGGTLLIVPPEAASSLDAVLRVKYPVAEGPPRRRFLALLLSIATALARSRSGDVSGALGWDDYTSSRDPEVARLDEAILELSHLIAGLAAVDGAVLMTSGFEILGFGAEITGRLPEVSSVRDALDVEGQRWVLEATEQLGTRHRSAYRFAAAVQDALAIVVSQDGGVRFATRRDQEVMSWHYLASGFDA
jgi:hypothetical protein